MKWLCPGCERLSDLTSFQVDGGVLTAKCVSCGATTSATADDASSPPAPEPVRASAPPPAMISPPRPSLQLASAAGASNVVALRNPTSDAVNAARDSADGNPFAIPEGVCPKCLSPRPASALACPACGVAFANFDANAIPIPEWLRTQWIALLQRWDETSAHEKLRTRALETSELAALGRLYRLRLAWKPDDPIAARGRDEVLRLALIPSTLPSTPLAPAERSPVAIAAAVLFFVVLMTAVFFAARNLLRPTDL